MQHHKKIALLSEILLHLIFWGMLIYIFNSSYSVKYATIKVIGGKKQMVVLTKNLLPHILLIIALKAAFFYIAVFRILPGIDAVRKKEAALLSVILIVVAVVTTEYFLLHFISRVTSLGLQEIKNLLPVNFILNIACLSATLAYYFTNRWRKAERTIEKIEKEQLLSELKIIKAQVTPHFLFNALNNVFSMAQQQGNDKLAEKISALSGFMRYVLDTNKKSKVLLQTEMDFIENYIDVMKMNYTDDEVNIQFISNGNLQNIFVPPMLFIPFVENIFKYGVQAGLPSNINLLLEIKVGMIIFSGTNPDYSRGSKIPANSFGIGLEAVARKVELYYAASGSVEYGTKDGVFYFTLKLPFND